MRRLLLYWKELVPARPRLVVITTAPLAASMPYSAAASGPFNTVIEGRRRSGCVRAQHSGIERFIIHREAVNDEQRLIAAADRADAANRDGGRGPRNTGRTVDRHAGNTSLERVYEVVALRFGD